MKSAWACWHGVRRLIFTALSLSVAVWGSSSPGGSDIWLTSILPYTGGEWDVGVSVRIGGQIMLEEINRNPHLLPDHELKVVWQDGQCDTSVATPLFIKNVFQKKYVAFAPGVPLDQLNINDNSQNLSETWGEDVVHAPVGLLGCGCSKTTIQVTTLALHTNFPIVSGTATFPALSDREKYPNFWRTIQPDSKFMGAYLALLKMLGFSKLSTVVGGIEIWSSYLTVLIEEAQRQGVTLDGHDLTSSIPGFLGYQVNRDSPVAAAAAAVELVRRPNRMVLMLMYETRATLTVCEAHKAGLANAIWMVFGWYVPKWWLQDGDMHDCDPEVMTKMVTGYISANVVFWRSDSDQRLSCSDGMTAEGFKSEWEHRQDANFVQAPEAASVADAVCMYAQMLHQILYVQNVSLQAVQQRSMETYTMIQDIFGATDFEGVTGQIKLAPDKGEPAGTILLQHLHTSPNGDTKVVDISEYNNRTLTFLGKSNLTFSLPGENYFAGPAGANHIDVGMDDFKTCKSPFILNLSTNDCQSCPKGMTYAAQFFTCSCSAGFAQAQPGAGDHCVACSPGSFTDGSGNTECQQCPTGKYTTEFGETECNRCGVGMYQDEKGRSECKACNRTMTTIGDGVESESLCVCGPGTRPGGFGECEPCGDEEVTGLVCKGGDDVEIAPGFYAADSSLSVFRCFDTSEDNRCVGGPPGNVCAAGREGLACADCEEGMRTGPYGTCVPCRGDGSGWITLILLFAGVIVLLSATYVYIDVKGTSQRGHAFLLLALALSMGVTIVQQLGIMAMFSQVEWPIVMRKILDIMQLMSLDMEAINFSCVARTFPLQRFILSVGFMLGCGVVLLVVHALMVLMRRKGDFRGRSTSLIASAGTLFMIFYITVLSNLLEPVQCRRNPNGVYTMQGSPSVICWETEEHRLMVAIGLLALMVPLGYLAKCCHVVWCFPAKMHAGEVEYLHTYYFLFFRYRSECYWYSLVHMFRSLMIANLPILPDVSAQILCMQAVLLSQLYCILAYRPWRVRVANQLDMFFTVSIMFILGIASFFVDVVAESSLSEVAVGVIIVIILLLPACGIWSLYKHCLAKHGKRFNYFVCHHKAAAGSFARLLKMVLLRTRTALREVFVDSDNLVDLDVLFDIVASQTEVLVLVASKGVFMRPWCVGELATAMQKGVPAVRLTLPDFREPTDDFIADYRTYAGDLSVLTRRGIGITDVQDAIAWGCGLHSVEVPQHLDDLSMDAVVQQVRDRPTDEVRTVHTGRSRSRPTTPFSRPSPSPRASSKAMVPTASTSYSGSYYSSHWQTAASQPRVSVAATQRAPGARDMESCNFIVRDELNLEATCSAMILARLLRPLFAQTPEELPKVLGHQEALPFTARKVILVCTNGSLEQENVLRNLFRGIEANARFLPVLLDDDFRFPTVGFARKHLALAEKVCGGTPGGALSLAESVRDIFKIVAMPFQSDFATAKALEGQALEIAERLRRKKKQQGSGDLYAATAPAVQLRQHQAHAAAGGGANYDADADGGSDSIGLDEAGAAVDRINSNSSGAASRLPSACLDARRGSLTWSAVSTNDVLPDLEDIPAEVNNRTTGSGVSLFSMSRSMYSDDQSVVDIV